MSVTEPSSADIERDAENERAELVSTLGQLRENLKPENVVDEVMANAKVSVNDLTDRMWKTARQHPLPAAMIGLGAAMILGVGQTVRSRHAAKEHDWTDESRFPRHGGQTTAPQDSAALRTFRSRVGAAQNQASSLFNAAADQLSGAANRTATSAREGLNSLSRNAAMVQNSRSRNQITQSLSRLLDEQPLVLAALGIAVGAAIGAAIPSTDAESEWMGEASDQVKQAARDMARDQYAQLKETASHTLDEVKRNATEHGLSSDNLSGLVQDVGNTVKTAATQVGGQVGGQTGNQGGRTEASI
jgi:hypothetical protein